MKRFLLILIISWGSFSLHAQNLSLKTQFNGRYDYTAIGNTLNLEENEVATNCQILTQSSATLSLNNNQTIEAAYLYWAGSGPGDFTVKLNGQTVQAEETYSFELDFYREFFAATAEVTNWVISQGNGNYTLSELDLTNFIGNYYCQTGTNFGGWALIVVYEDSSLPLNQINIYEGLQVVSIDNNSITIQLDNLNVIDDNGAKIGFLAWEGDAALSVEESLVINNNTISNPPLNPADNAFNSTNSFTGSSDLYNMDLDVYLIGNYIQPGDQSATIVLNSGNGVVSSDMVMVNNIITVLNSELPEPEPQINTVQNTCDRDSIMIDYTVTNFNATDTLPAGNPIDFYANTIFLGSTETQNKILIGESESGQVSFAIPPAVPNNFTLQMVVNRDDNGTVFVDEITPENDTTSQIVTLDGLELADSLVNLSQCDDPSNDGKAIFDLTVNTALAIGNQQDVQVTFYRSQSDAMNENDPITNPGAFQNESVPQVIYLRLSSDQGNCILIKSFVIDLFFQPPPPDLTDLSKCKPVGFEGSYTFNLREQAEIIYSNQTAVRVDFYETQNEAVQEENKITDTLTYSPDENSTEIWVRVTNPSKNECYAISSFELKTREVPVKKLDSLQNCDQGFNQAHFDLTQIMNQLNLSSSQTIEGYYTTLSAAVQLQQKIINPAYFQNPESPQKIYVRVNQPNSNCDAYYQFSIDVRNCPPFIPEGFSPNGDGVNDRFFISGLYDIFPDFEIKIFSRYGNIVYEGDNSTESWDGTANRGLTAQGNKLPSGTYYYVLNLHDPDYDIFKGWVYLQR